ncbi:hypothetical protein NL431_28170, partial [Klebsiella pneumoniae]|nr:hypothetical protein [Klebsiella pneumoniae]
TLGEVLDKLNEAMGTKGTASVNAVNNAIVIRDATSPKANKLLSISDFAGSSVAYDLGISGAARSRFGGASNQFEGKSLLNFNNR